MQIGGLKKMELSCARFDSSMPKQHLNVTYKNLQPNWYNNMLHYRLESTVQICMQYESLYHLNGVVHVMTHLW